MSGDQANVSYEAIANLEISVGRFGQATLEKLKRSRTAVRRICDQLDVKQAELRQEISSLRSAISAADEDEDTSSEERRLEEAETELHEVRRWRRTIDDCAVRFTREARRVEDLCTATTAETRTYLRGLLRDLSAYFAFQNNAIGGQTAIGTRTASEVHNANAEVFDPTVFSLPPGYNWVPISEIDTAGELAELQSAEAFEKVPYGEMRRGFDALAKEILPAISNNTNPATPDLFASRDSMAGVTYEHGLQRVYEAFFGDDPIYLSRRGSGKFSVTNGRHRIKVAVDVGWSAVPAKTRDSITP